MWIRLQAVSTNELLAGNSVELFLKSCGYTDKEVALLKRPFNNVVPLPDGKFMYRKKCRGNDWYDGYLYIVADSMDWVSSRLTFKNMCKILSLTQTVCNLKEKEDGST